MSRTGDRREILLVPLFYGIVFVVITLVYWKTSPIGKIALMILCGGDGYAEKKEIICWIAGVYPGRSHLFPNCNIHIYG